jgi:hypothetical protein
MLTVVTMMAVMVSGIATTTMASPLQNLNPASTFTTLDSSTLLHSVTSPIATDLTHKG